MSRSRDLGSSINSTVAGKNFVINGGMDIWQRGTSISLVASTQRSGGFGPDRWQMETGASQATTISRQPTNDTTNLPNIQYAVRIQRNSGQTGTTGQYFTQTLETSNSIPYAGKTVTFSFYARAGANYSTASNSLYPKLWSNNTTDGSIWNGGWNEVNGPTIALTTSWQRFTITGTIGVTQTQIAVGFLWNPTGTAGVNDYFEITGVQIEVGSVATQFSRAGGDIHGELAKCQRYYYSSTLEKHLGSCRDTALAFFTKDFPVTMRTSPSFTHNVTTKTSAGSFPSTIGQIGLYGNGWIATNATPISCAGDGSGSDNGTFYILGYAVTAGQTFALQSNGLTNFSWSAEL